MLHRKTHWTLSVRAVQSSSFSALINIHTLPSCTSLTESRADINTYQFHVVSKITGPWGVFRPRPDLPSPPNSLSYHWVTGEGEGVRREEIEISELNGYLESKGTPPPKTYDRKHPGLADTKGRSDGIYSLLQIPRQGPQIQIRYPITQVFNMYIFSKCLSPSIWMKCLQVFLQ